MVTSATGGESRPIYEGLEDTTRDTFFQHGWPHNLRIGSPPTP
jgi:hypothetical protein